MFLMVIERHEAILPELPETNSSSTYLSFIEFGLRSAFSRTFQTRLTRFLDHCVFRSSYSLRCVLKRSPLILTTAPLPDSWSLVFAIGISSTGGKCSRLLVLGHAEL